MAQDLPKGISYINESAQAGDSEAQNLMGYFYYNGINVSSSEGMEIYVERDMSRATYYFTLAAEQESPEAIFYLGEITLSNSTVGLI